MGHQSFQELLRPFKKQIESALNEAFHNSSKLDEACRYSLEKGGKRFRPALVLMVAKALGKPFEVIKAALAVEYFHTASLIADDLPCMDDDDERRGEMSLHVAFGEARALLASYALIAEGYRLLAENGKDLEKSGLENGATIALAVIENASYNTGIGGAAGGQDLDLFPPKIDKDTYIETVLKKTVSLFEISFVTGWLFGAGSIDKLDKVKKAAYHYGMAFQMADDFDDYQEDQNEERLMNAVSLFGQKKAYEIFQEELKHYLELLEELSLNSAELIGLAEFLKKKIPS